MSEKGTELRVQRPVDHAASPVGWPVNDVLIRRRLLALDRRYLFALPSITVGRVTRDIVHELRQIAVDYEDLLRSGLSVSAHFSERAVRAKIGDALARPRGPARRLQIPSRRAPTSWPPWPSTHGPAPPTRPGAASPSSTG
jgi:hypothetical protein